MSDFVQNLFTFLGGSVAAVACIYFVAKAIVNQYLARDIERFKANLKRDQDIAIENLKAELAIQKAEHEVRFKKIHDSMADKLMALFPLIQKSFNSMASFVSPLDYSHEGTKEDKLKNASKAFDEMLIFTHDNRIYLTDEVFDVVDDFTQKVRKTIEDFSRAHTRAQSGKSDDEAYWSTANDRVRNEVMPLFEKIRHRLQEIIGVRPKPKN